MFGRLLDRLDQATRPAQYIAMFLTGLALDEIARARIAARRARAPRA